MSDDYILPGKVDAISAATLLIKWQKSLGIQENDQALKKATSIVQANKVS